jgi:hypothetical protein
LVEGLVDRDRCLAIGDSPDVVMPAETGLARFQLSVMQAAAIKYRNLPALTVGGDIELDKGRMQRLRDYTHKPPPDNESVTRALPVQSCLEARKVCLQFQGEKPSWL